MSGDPSLRLLSIDLLGDDEHDNLDVWGNRAVLTRPAPAAASIPELFSAQVNRTPTATALTCAERSWSYLELDRTANRLAHVLVDHGARPGAVVALLFTRSAEAIIAILAVLKSGAAYLPIDPAHPDARIAFMVTDAAPVVAVATADLRARLTNCDIPVIVGDGLAYDGSPDDRLPEPAADDLAYLTYTSGTTGVPKAVAVTHLNVTQLLQSLPVELPSGGQQVWSQWHSLVFDVSVWEIWGACCTVAAWWWCRSRWEAHRWTCMTCCSHRRSRYCAKLLPRQECCHQTAWIRRHWWWQAKPARRIWSDAGRRGG
ncbi:linear gramicidin synthetase subunit D [Mycolicibacterium conceptionense]|uniref:Linear gramicidin synthetase subunit D n=1 Tax=Mycolicibacterium conceptionense TaxID=451644 RepID=A0A0U1DBS5_9MYCO|nr:linear gramicidin synthetase subunit D [Mycolicibacterium conceptionense]